ncbi:hypothetical protein K3495_g12017, partial [Podosphaera aphanis]
STKDRQEAKERFAKRITGTKRFDSYLLDYEGTENDEDETWHQNDSDSDIEALILNIDNINVTDPIPENFHASIDSIANNHAKNHYQELMNRSTFHSITHQTPKSTPEIGMTSESLLISASTTSTAGIGQAEAYMKEFNASIDSSTAGNFNAHFSIGSASSIGTIVVKSPFGRISFQVVQADTPFLLCVQDMDKLQVYFNNLNDELVLQDGSRLPVARVFNHPFVVWGRASTNYLTDIELR